MKKLMTLFAMCCAFIAFSNSSYAQVNNHPGSYSLTVDPIDFLVSKTLNATFEFKLNPKNSFTINGSYYAYSDWWKGYGLGASYRWYIDLFNEGKKALNGFSVGPMVRASWWTYEFGGYKADTEMYVAIGAEAAYKWVFSGGWTIEPIVRLGFGVTDVTGLGYEGYGGGVNIGYTW